MSLLKISGTPTNKGNYLFCDNCVYQLSEGKYPCAKSHSQVRRSGGVRYERDFKICGLLEIKDKK